MEQIFFLALMLAIGLSRAYQSPFISKSRSFVHFLSDKSQPINMESLVVEDVLKIKDNYDYVPQGTGYIMCSTCKTAYLMNESELVNRGLRVKCGLCEKEWFQSIERLMKTDNVHFVQKMDEAKVNQIKTILAEKNFPKYPKIDKVGVFVGNLPYTYTEKEIGDLFGEYGITNIALVRAPDGLSKGFAFVEACTNN